MAQSKVMVIPARRQVGNTIKSAEKPKLRVAAYCRVSTDSDEQATSYDAQIEHYTEYISTNPEWQLAGIFADDGICGTNTKKRTEFNRMIDECMAGRTKLMPSCWICKRSSFRKQTTGMITILSPRRFSNFGS